MKTPAFFRRCLVAGALAFLPQGSLRAVIFDYTGSPTFNTQAPIGTLTNSGWQYEGLWNNFLGTAIAPNFFLTASHVGGNVGDSFTLGSTAYVTTAFFDDPNSDLRIWQVAGTLPTFALLYTKSNEVGKSLVVIGRGTQRGDDVMLGGTLHGWLWGASDGVERWGENVVSGTANFSAGLGSMLVARFDHNAGTNEATLSVGDSGGAVFLKDGATWKLAGINYAVDGPYSSSPDGSAATQAALFDQSGFYEASGSGVVAVSGPGEFYATRVSTNQTWINSVIPEPSAVVLAMLGAAAGAVFSLWKKARSRPAAAK